MSCRDFSERGGGRKNGNSLTMILVMEDKGKCGQWEIDIELR
jgi:hypothetical protein